MTRVVFRRGSGAKHKLNGKQARILTSGSGGWAEVQCPDGTTIKWRTGHWDAEACPPILLVPSGIDGLMGTILGELPLQDVVTCMRTARCFLAARDAPATWTDADFLAVRKSKRLAFAAFLLEGRARIRTLRMTVGLKEHVICCKLLRQCCISTMETCVLDLTTKPYILREAEGCIDVTKDTAVYNIKRLPEIITESQELCSDVPVALKACASLHSLRIAAYWSTTIGNDSVHVAQLRKLECFFKTGALAQAVIEHLPLLEHLILRVDFGERLELKHNKLRIIDMRDSDKHSTIQSLACPELRTLVFGEYHSYGNGARLIHPVSRHVVHELSCDGDHDLGNLKNELHGLDELNGLDELVQLCSLHDASLTIDVPAGCEVTWTGHPVGLRMTAGKTWADLFRMIYTNSVLGELGGWKNRLQGGLLPREMVERFQQEASVYLRQAESVSDS